MNLHERRSWHAAVLFAEGVSISGVEIGELPLDCPCARCFEIGARSAPQSAFSAELRVSGPAEHGVAQRIDGRLALGFLSR